MVLGESLIERKDKDKRGGNRRMQLAVAVGRKVQGSRLKVEMRDKKLIR